MATLAVTNSFSAGTTIVAADMNQNFDDVEAFVNTTPGVVQKDIVDAKGDIIAATAADAVSRLAVGTNTHVLTADSTEATGLKWAVSPPMDVVTTLGDLIVGTAADTVARLAAGTDTYVLTADSTTGTGLIWSAPTTGDLTGLTAGTNIDISSASGPVPTITLAVDAALVTGSDGVGVDVTFHSDTAGDNMVWDSSEEKLTITGTNGQTALDVPDGNVTITDALTVSGGITAPITINNETASYTLVAGDAGGIVEMNNGSANNLTIPPNSSVAFATGTQIIIVQQGAGATTIVEGSGVTTRSLDDNAIINGQYVSVALVKRDTDEWYIFGNLTS